MSKVATTPKTFTAKHSYDYFSKKLLNENNLLIGIRKYGFKFGEILNQDKSVYINYKLYKEILSLVYNKAGIKLINGDYFNLGNYLGYIYIMRQGRNPANKPRLNKGESFKYKRQLEAEGKEITKENWKIYYTDDEFVRTNWSKTSFVKNILFYEFSPANGQPGKGFKQLMSRSISSNQNLLALYPFIPYKQKNVSI